jgi:hypothetical protein
MLFVTGLTVLGDLVSLVFVFLQGEISTRFILKVLAVLVVAVGIFAHYIVELRASAGFLKRFKNFALITGILILAVLVASFAIVGLPQDQRAARFDEQRINDLSNIQYNVISYYQHKGEVPASLEDLDDSLSYSSVPTDPQTHAEYQYQKISTTSFKLCASFGTSYMEPGNVTDSYNKGALSSVWTHDKGTVCFARTIDPDFYPLVNDSTGSPTKIPSR